MSSEAARRAAERIHNHPDLDVQQGWKSEIADIIDEEFAPALREMREGRYKVQVAATDLKESLDHVLATTRWSCVGVIALASARAALKQAEEAGL